MRRFNPFANAKKAAMGAFELGFLPVEVKTEMKQSFPQMSEREIESVTRSARRVVKRTTMSCY